MCDDGKSDVICLCSGATKEQIRELLDDGTVDLERISRITGALSGCGGCESDLKEFVEKHSSAET